MKKHSLLLLLFTIWACQKGPYSMAGKIYTSKSSKYSKTLKSKQNKEIYDWVSTSNFDMRKPNLVVIHHTAQNSCEQTLKTFTIEKTKVSAHYVICRNGTVHQMLNDYLRAWHAGVGSWGHIQDINSCSIGIELDNNGSEPFPQPQINALVVLLDSLKNKYKIPTENFIGHSDLAPKRKNDPSVFFDWEYLNKAGFGRWYADTAGLLVPDSFDPKMALRVIGYAPIPESIEAFNRKYLRKDNQKDIDSVGLKILFSLINK